MVSTLDIRRSQWLEKRGSYARLVRYAQNRDLGYVQVMCNASSLVAYFHRNPSPDNRPRFLIEAASHDRTRVEKKVNLKTSSIIVAGGAGVGNREKFELIFKLASCLGASVGATWAAVDGGLIHRDHQVGQTGTTVRPRLYIACGISGAVQHRAGMTEAKKIVAINTDPDAPIFDIAHYGIVGDLNQVIPRMITAYKSKSGGTLR